jgi:Tol biopolymer transport system component
MKSWLQGRGFFLLLLLTGALGSSGAPFQLVSARDPSQDAPAGGNGDSYGPILTPDGRYVLFASTANNLVVNAGSNNVPSVSLPAHLNVFVRDRTNGTTTLASVNLNGAGGNGNSFPMGISTNGRYALFESVASDLVAGDTNGVSDIFVRDLIAGTTTLVNVSTNAGCADGVSRSPTISPDGRFVAFFSAADNLVANDTNGIPDVFLRDLQAATTTVVSVGAQATNSLLLNSSEAPEISADGRYVAFYSTATNLVAGVATSGEIYVRDTLAGSTIWASTNARTLATTILSNSNIISYNHALSADGKFVAFVTSTDPANISYDHGLVLRFSLDTGLTDIIYTNAAVTFASGAEDIHNLDMSPDGRFVAYIANGGSNNFALTTSIYLWDSQTGSNTLISVNTNNTVSLNAMCDWPSVDTSGRYVAFLSSATNLVTNSLSGQYQYHLYLRDVQAGITSLLDKDTNAIGSSVAPSTIPRMNAAGGVIAFESPDANIVANDRNHDSDVFLLDTGAGSVELVSARDPTLASSTANGSSAASTFSLNGDGRYVAFTSDADNLVPSDTNGVRDIFVRDLFTGQAVLASVGTNGNAANGPSSEPAISGNGRYVAFSTTASNLALNDTNRAQDVFVHDLQSGATILVSVSTSGNAPGNHGSYSPVISYDGRYVLFQSLALNLAAGNFSGIGDLFLRDMQSAVTYALTTGGVLASAMTPDGRYVAFNPSPYATLYLWDTQVGGRVLTNTAASGIVAISISPDGNRIVYVASPGNLWAIDRTINSTWLITNQVSAGLRPGLRFSANGQFLVYNGSAGYTNGQILLYDFGTRTSALVSKSLDGLSAGHGNSDSPDLSADGRFVVYRSFATNLVATANTANTLGLPHLFLYDRSLDTTMLLTRSLSNGIPADNRSLAPSFSANGHVLACQTWASDLSPFDFNHGSDVLALSLFYANITPASSPLQGPTLTWPAHPGETYQVQTNGVSNSGVWQNAGGSISIIGNQAQFTDPAPAVSQKFYRIIAF